LIPKPPLSKPDEPQKGTKSIATKSTKVFATKEHKKAQIHFVFFVPFAAKT
jgi:hypothetical protein